MKNYFKYFRFWFLAILILGGALLVVTMLQAGNNELQNYTRENTETLTEERVFDYADVLTDREEEKLRILIEKRQQQIGCDIVIITINESLESFAATQQSGYVAVEDYPKLYAEKFFVDNALGFNQVKGDGALYLDNWYRESDGYRYTWFLTSGKVKEKYSQEMIDMLINKVIEFTNLSPYIAYKTYVNTLYHDMSGSGSFNIYIPTYGILIFTAVISLIYIGINLSGNRNNKTTMAATYVNGGKARINNQQDLFMSKHITQRRIETNTGGGRSGGGGGGGGGGSFGGGGGRH